MVIKSLTITEDAYETLKKLKFKDESFSEVILRISKGKSNVIEKYFGILKMSEKEVNEWQKRIKEGRKEFDKHFKERQEKFKEMLKEHDNS